MRRATLDEIVAAYLLDRAHQYDADSPCWVALADAASDVVNGEHRQSHVEGDLDGLIERVRSWRGRPGHPVQPSAGVDPHARERARRGGGG